MIFCGYCGKQYTRKEHLERHIPQHTNVKPHRCSGCQISFARKDLLRRHFEIYHVESDPTEPLPGSAVANRPIACWNCAQAKAGCDKKVPCSRCEARKLPCTARYASRRSKTVMPPAQARTTAAATSAPDSSPSPGHLDQQPNTPPIGLVHYMDPGAEPLVQSPLNLEEQKIVHGAADLDMCLPLETMPSLYGQLETLEEPILDGYFDYSMATNVDLNPLYLDIPIPHVVPPLTATNTELSDISSCPMPTTPMSLFEGVVPIRGPFTLPSDEKCGSIFSRDAIPEFEEFAASEAAWTSTCYNPPPSSGSCPCTSILHLVCQEPKPKQEGGSWSALEQVLESQPDAADPTPVVPLAPLTFHSRDKLIAITQSFFSKALDHHRSALCSKSCCSKSCAGDAAGQSGDFNFIVLPPLRILDIFLRKCVHSLAIYHPLTEGNVMDPNEMLDTSSPASSLLVLLMIAEGAATVPIPEARYLSAGLSEICRVAIFDILDKTTAHVDLTAFRCALLSTHLGTWSGNKWQMDLATRQYSVYLRMLKSIGILEPQLAQSLMTSSFGSQTSAEEQRHMWLRCESQSRLVYNWVVMDQEFSLFQDTAPVMSVSDTQCPLPSSDALWLPGAGSQMQGQDPLHPPMPSLYELFRDFCHDNLARRRDSLSPQQLRLLLHPLQSLLYHYRQILSYVPRQYQSLSKVATVQSFEEVRALLQTWYKLSTYVSRANPNCAATHSNLVLYHLISLSAVSNFPEVERLARREGLNNFDGELGLCHKRCILQRGEAIFHCGQIMRLLRQMPVGHRPSWWSVALYRALLVLWVDSICHFFDSSLSTVEDYGSSSGGNNDSANYVANSSEGNSSLVVIDQITPEDQVTVNRLLSRDGIPVLTRIDHSFFTLDSPSDILSYGIQRLQEAVSTGISEGIYRKIMMLASTWTDEGRF